MYEIQIYHFNTLSKEMSVEKCVFPVEYEIIVNSGITTNNIRKQINGKYYWYHYDVQNT